MAARGPKGGAAREAWRMEEGLKESLLEGMSPAEWQQAMQAIGGIEQTGRARVADVMGRGGAAFDPRAFARASAPLAGGTQRAIGALSAQKAQMKRQGLMQWIQILQRRAGQEQQRRATSRAGTMKGLTSMFGFGTQMMQAGGRGGMPTGTEDQGFNYAAGPIQTPTYPAAPTRPYEQQLQTPTGPFTTQGLSPTWDWMSPQ